MKSFVGKASAFILATILGITPIVPIDSFASDYLNEGHTSYQAEFSVDERFAAFGRARSLNALDSSSVLENVNMQMDVAEVHTSIAELEISIHELEIVDAYEDTTASEYQMDAFFEGIEPMVSNAFFWNRNTIPFNPANMQATTDVDIVWNQFVNGQFATEFDLWGTGFGSMVSASTFNANSQQDYLISRNEGHINDFFGVFGQPHTYVSFNSVNPFITIFAGYRVRALVFDSNGNLAFDSGHLTNGNRRSPAASSQVVAWNDTSATAFGSSRDVYFLQMRPGTYFVSFINYNPWPVASNFMDNLYHGFYYAFHTGMPLPAQRLLREPVAHSGTVTRATQFTSSTTSAIRQFSLNSSRPTWFAINGVTFDTTPIIGNFMVSSISYEYRAPNSSSFWNRVQTTRPTMRENLTDWSPPTGSIIGTWQFRFIANWNPNSPWGGVLASTSAITGINIDFLVPFGSGL